MSLDNKTAILMVTDPLVLKGLHLLLEDMGFHVISTCHAQELQALADPQAQCPDLLILPLEFDNGKSGNDLTHKLRETFQQRIPAILLSHENGLSHTRYVKEGVVVLSEQIKPKDLRNKITALLRNELAV